MSTGRRAQPPVGAVRDAGSRRCEGQNRPIAARSKADFAEEARHAVYGSVIVLAVIVALDDTQVSAGDALTSTVSAALVTVFAELYADYLGATIRSGRRPTGAEERKSIRNTALGFLAALLPAVFFVFAVLDTIELHTAFTIATWTGIGVVGTYAFVANRLAGMPILGSAFAGLGFAVLGAILVALKAIVH